MYAAQTELQWEVAGKIDVGRWRRRSPKALREALLGRGQNFPISTRFLKLGKICRQ
jgi:hypothetical protein